MEEKSVPVNETAPEAQAPADPVQAQAEPAARPAEAAPAPEAPPAEQPAEAAPAPEAPPAEQPAEAAPAPEEPPAEKPAEAAPAPEEPPAEQSAEAGPAPEEATPEEPGKPAPEEEPAAEKPCPQEDSEPSSLTGRRTKFRSFGDDEDPSQPRSFSGTAKSRAESAAAAAGTAWQEFRRSDYAHQAKRMWSLFWDTFQNRGWQFSGRANRTEFWVFLVGSLLISSVLSILSSIPLLGLIAALASLIWWVVTIVPTCSVAFRRLHDTGRSGWWVAGPLLGIMSLLFLFPASFFLTVFVLTLSGVILVIGGILFLVGLVFCALPGDDVANQYGDVPEDLHIFE